MNAQTEVNGSVSASTDPNRYDDKIIALMTMITELKERSSGRLSEGTAAAQAARLQAYALLSQTNPEGLLQSVQASAQNVHIYTELQAVGDTLKDSLTGSLEAYAASLSGREGPILSAAQYERNWQASNGTCPEAIVPYFEGMAETLLAVVEVIIARATAKLAEADSL